MKVYLNAVSFSKISWPVEGAPKRWMEQHGLEKFFKVSGTPGEEIRFRVGDVKEIELTEFQKSLPAGVEITFSGFATHSPPEMDGDGRAKLGRLEVRGSWDPLPEMRTVPVEYSLHPDEENEEESVFLEGLAAVFDKTIPIFGSNEVIRAGAFARALKEKQDVRALLNHDPSLILGRTKAKTLELRENDKGLFSRIKLPRNSVGRDIAESVGRGDVDGMSFQFIVRKQNVIPETSKRKRLREILDVDLFDVSVVTFPAFPQTKVGLKSDEAGEHDNEFRQKRQRLAELDI